MGRQRDVIAFFIGGSVFVICVYLTMAQVPFSLSTGYKRYDCPKCDYSVFSYCSDKLLHDACCCLTSHDLPYQCHYADCSFLHANSCHEHKLITACCCSKLVFQYK
ncbi:uncharacterized protein [Periplaneta americana]|uniref:uncharacterized protein n=1 Tax=Periplaneta americana TaxID=6978 RepID=UPI0037E944E4